MVMLMVWFADRTCPLLPVPDNAVLFGDCPRIPGRGSVCTHVCRSGFEAVDGDKIRTCLEGGLWSGKPLRCVISGTCWVGIKCGVMCSKDCSKIVPVVPER